MNCDLSPGVVKLDWHARLQSPGDLEQTAWLLQASENGALRRLPPYSFRAQIAKFQSDPRWQHQIWMRRRQEAFAWLARLAPCAGGAALFDGARSEAGLAGALRSAPRRVSGIRCDARKLIEASDCVRAAEWALRSLLAASPEFHRTPAAGLGKRAESFVAVCLSSAASHFIFI